MTAYYLAARFSRLDEMLGVRDVLEAFGHTVTSRWIDGNHQADEHDIDALRRFAVEDVEDIKDADVLIAFTEEPRTAKANRGGRHVELGFVLGAGGITIVVGPYENAFTTLADEYYPDWSRFVMALTGGRTFAPLTAAERIAEHTGNDDYVREGATRSTSDMG